MTNEMRTENREKSEDRQRAVIRQALELTPIERSYLEEAGHSVLCDVTAHWRPMLHIPHNHKRRATALRAELEQTGPACSCGITALRARFGLKEDA